MGYGWSRFATTDQLPIERSGVSFGEPSRWSGPSLFGIEAIVEGLVRPVGGVRIAPLIRGG